MGEKQLLATFQDGLELELRIKDVPLSMFVGMLREYKLQHTVIIDAIEPIDINTKNVVRYIMDNASVKTEWTLRELQVYTKKKINQLDMKLLVMSRLALSSENKIEKSDIKSKILRTSFKHRFSCVHPYNDKWRIDMSVALYVDSRESSIESDLLNFINMGDTVDKLIGEIIKNIHIYKYEIEFEYIGKKVDIMAANLNELLSIVSKYITGGSSDNTLIYLRELRSVYEIFEKNPVLIDKRTCIARHKYILPAVKTLMKSYYKQIYPPITYLLTGKADGVRTIMSVHDKKIRLLLPMTLQEYDFLKYDKRHTICDCEYIAVSNTLLLFDVVMYDGLDLSEKGIEHRILYMDKIIHDFDTFKDFNIYKKNYFPLSRQSEYSDIFTSAYNSTDFKMDGLILVQTNQSYRTTDTYKWKPMKYQTIDLYAVRSHNHDSRPGYATYIMFCTINSVMRNKLGLLKINGYNEMFPDVMSNSYKNIPIQFTTPYVIKSYILFVPVSDNTDYHHKILELHIRDENNPIITHNNTKYMNWEILKIRDDLKIEPGITYGNAYQTALDTFMCIIDPFSLEMLYNGVPMTNYFKVSKSELYVALTAYGSFVKNILISNLKSKNNIADFACGQGQDIKKYIMNGFKKVLAVDNDKAALIEMISRWYHIISTTKHGVYVNTRLHVMTLDLTTSVSDKILGEHELFTNIVCNFAIHYFCKNTADINQFVKTCSDILAPDSEIIITCMDGGKVFDILKNTDKFDIIENDMLKISIMKKYTENVFEKVGQKIGMLMSFTNGEYYDEYLVNTDYLVELFRKYNIVLKEKIPFIRYLDMFKHKNNEMYTRLQDGDKLHWSNYCIMHFIKN